MRYIEVKIYVSPAGLEPVTALLIEQGVTGVAIDDPREIAESASRKTGPGPDYFDEALLAAGAARAGEIEVSFYLEDDAEGARRFADIKLELMKLKGLEFDGVFGEGLPLGRLFAESVRRSDDEWKDVWKQYFKPFRLTERLTVRPGFENDTPAAPFERVIRLDPGMAFGTGRHETTALCARLLEASVKPGASVLDIGCGSGILSIAAALLGAGEVLAVDLDDTAVAVARDNIAANACADLVRVVRGDLLAGLDFAADIAVANLTADLIATLAGGLRAHLKAGGSFIASGILEERCDFAISAVEAAGFRVAERVLAGEWCAIRAV
ncbi:MAG: 50S ribosomal protein L11 methyltransferase [Clostridiales Family XIII bacterium]|jgi:ribosomal protein L11 methyltransferase|nr:50S ribosomal protein L11 methyltransferase [Clostridiales Family XIII bacterium]